jgi:hypothetical protein
MRYADREKLEERSLAVKEEMFGKFDTVIVAGGIQLPCHRYTLAIYWTP